MRTVTIVFHKEKYELLCRKAAEAGLTRRDYLFGCLADYLADPQHRRPAFAPDLPDRSAQIRMTISPTDKEEHALLKAQHVCESTEMPLPRFSGNVLARAAQWKLRALPAPAETRAPRDPGADSDAFAQRIGALRRKGARNFHLRRGG